MQLQLGLYTSPPSSGGTLVFDATPFLTSCDFSTDVRGFAGLTANALRTLQRAFLLYDSTLLYLGLLAGGQIVWEGRLEDPTLDTAGFTAQALGAWRALSDVPYTALWSTTEVGGFLQTTGDMGLTAYDESERWTRDTNNRLYITLTKGNAYTLNKRSGLLYGIPHRSTRNIVGIQFALEMNLPTTFTFRVVSFAGDISTVLSSGAAEAALVGTGALLNRAYHIILATPRETCGVEILCNTAATPAGETGASYAKVTNVRLVTASTNRVNTTLTANRAAGAGATATVGSTARMYVGMQLVISSGNNPSEIVTVTSITSATQFVATFLGNYVIGNAVQGFAIYADEIAKDMVSIVSTLNSTQLSSSTALIQSPGLDLLDEVYEDVAMGEILTRLAFLGDVSTNRYEIGVYEGRALFFRPQLSASRAWYVDATDLAVVRTLENLANAVYVVYRDANGRAQRIAELVSGVSVAQLGITRRQAVATNTTNITLAQVIRTTAVLDTRFPLPRATIQFDAVYDSSGARYPLWLVRAGDTITIRNLPPNLSTSVDRIRTFRITHTSYDAFANTLEVEPEAPPSTLEVLLARRAEGF